MCYFRTVPLSGEKIQTTQHRILVPLRSSFQNFWRPSASFKYGRAPTPFARSNLQMVNVIRTELHEDIQYFLYKTLHWHNAGSPTNRRSIQHWHDEDERLKRKCQKTIKDDDKGCAWHSSDWLRKISYACGGGNMTSMIDIWVGFSHHTISMKEVGRFASEVLAKQEDHQ